MTDRSRDAGGPASLAGVLRDISLLYELSLSVGRSLDLTENCEAFLSTLMARKNLYFASVWVRNEALGGEASEVRGFTQVHASPAFRSPNASLGADHPLARRVEREPMFTVAHGEPGFDELVTESGIDRGAWAVFRLGSLGFLKLHSSARDQRFDEVELSKLRHVIETFAISVAGCLDHERVRTVEQQRRELELQMLHAQKLESLGLLAGGIAHDFNNLLTVVLGNAELLAADVPEHAMEGLDNIVGASSRAADLCSQLLAYSGRGRFEVTPLRLDDAVDEMLKLTSVTISKKATVVRDLDSAGPAIEADASQVRQVVLNLVTNASEALGDDSGVIRISTGLAFLTRDDLAGFELGGLRTPGTFAYLDVEDSGCGMEEATRKKLFDPFFSTKFTGRGLGMAAVLGVVRSHQGAIRVRSMPGAGTLVRVLFPTSTSVVERSAPPPVPSARTPRVTALIVDDEEPVRRVLARLLTKLGHRVLQAENGAEAVRVFEQQGDAIDLVLLDLTMPVMNGDEAYARLKERRADCPVVLMSGFSEVETSQRFREPKPAAFLTKPFRAARVAEVVESVLTDRGPRT